MSCIQLIDANKSAPMLVMLLSAELQVHIYVHVYSYDESDEYH